jgi:hypothetical protein
MVRLENVMNDDEKERSSISVEFEEIGSVNIIRYEAMNITPMQLLAMAHFLEFEGKNSLAVQRQAQMQEEMRRQQREQIIVPKTKVEL